MTSSLLSLSAPHRSRSFSFDSVPYQQQQQQQQLSAIATGTAAAVSVCPDSPDTNTDFSQLSFSSALLTPLDSPHSLSPVHSANIGIAGIGGQHSPIRAAHAHLHNLGHGHGHGHGLLHSPTHSHSHWPISTHSIHHSPTHSIHASPLHSPTQLFGLGGGLGYPNTKDQQRFTSTYSGYGYRDSVLFNGGGSEPPSPGYGVGVGQYSPPGHPGHGSGGRGYASASPNAAIPALPNDNNKSPLFTGEAPAVAYCHHQATTDAGEHWIRGDASDGMSDANVGGSLGLGLGAGFAQTQSNSPGGVGTGFVDPGASRGMGFVARDAFVGASASANGLGVTLGPEDLNALRGSLAYHQQQLAQQQQLLLHHQRQQEALALANANANASANANNEFSGSKDGALDGRGHERRGSDSVPVSPGQSPNGSSGREGRGSNAGNEPINFLSLLHPSSSPPYATFVSRIIKSADQQASIFLQQKLKVAGPEERARIVDAICARGAEMMMHRFGNWAVQHCLEAATTTDERRKLVACMRVRVVDLATNCYGCHVLQKALDCEEEEVRLLIVSELLMGDPAHTLVNKHASHVWSKIMELSWTPPAPPIFAYVNKSLKGKWAALACHETGSLVVSDGSKGLESDPRRR
ncbi:hypothetical protein C8F01DRAFT_1274072 [Mycena amicta]|nr:hypothetical protein C8F01DRAFT_1274072 [Mycena amicta]